MEQVVSVLNLINGSQPRDHLLLKVDFSEKALQTAITNLLYLISR